MDCCDTTALRARYGLMWFRVLGHGLWVKWDRSPDLYTVRMTAHYLGRVRWRVLRP
jgi:hypothetical protein